MGAGFGYMDYINAGLARFDMLQEKPCRQIPDEPPRRWIYDDYFDLIVWGESCANPYGFQLCYDKPGWEHALTWTAKGGYSHAQIDGGDTSPHSISTPVLVAGGEFPAEKVRKQFLWRSAEIDPQVRDLVLAKIEEYAACGETKE